MSSKKQLKIGFCEDCDHDRSPLKRHHLSLYVRTASMSSVLIFLQCVKGCSYIRKKTVKVVGSLVDQSLSNIFLMFGTD